MKLGKCTVAKLYLFIYIYLINSEQSKSGTKIALVATQHLLMSKASLTALVRPAEEPRDQSRTGGVLGAVPSAAV